MNAIANVIVAVCLGVPAILILLRLIKWKGESLLSYLFNKLSLEAIDRIAFAVIKVVIAFIYVGMFHLAYAPFRLHKTGEVCIDTVTNARAFMMTGGYPVITTDESTITGKHASYKCDFYYAKNIKRGQRIFVFCNIKNRTGIILQDRRPPTLFYIYTHYFHNVVDSVFMEILCLIYLSFIPITFLFLLIPEIKKIWSSSVVLTDNALIKFFSVVKGFAPFAVIFLSSYAVFGLLFKVATSYEGKSDFVPSVIAFFSFNILLFLPLIINSIKYFIESTENMFIKTAVAATKCFFAILLVVSAWKVATKERFYLSDVQDIIKNVARVVLPTKGK